MVTVPLLCFARRYDRTKLSLKEITNVQYVSCMNPTAGSFTINPRLQVKPCTTAGASLRLFWGGSFKREARGQPLADPAVVSSVQMARICRVTVIPNSEAANWVPYSLVCFSSHSAAQSEEEVKSCQTA